LKVAQNITSAAAHDDTFASVT